MANTTTLTTLMVLKRNLKFTLTVATALIYSVAPVVMTRVAVAPRPKKIVAAAPRPKNLVVAAPRPMKITAAPRVTMSTILTITLTTLTVMMTMLYKETSNHSKLQKSTQNSAIHPNAMAKWEEITKALAHSTKLPRALVLLVMHHLASST